MRGRYQRRFTVYGAGGVGGLAPPPSRRAGGAPIHLPRRLRDGGGAARRRSRRGAVSRCSPNGGHTVAHDRLSTLFQGEDGHFRGIVELDCESDEAAILAVAAHADGSDMELWQRQRLVKAFSERSRGAGG